MLAHTSAAIRVKDFHRSCFPLNRVHRNAQSTRPGHYKNSTKIFYLSLKKLLRPRTLKASLSIRLRSDRLDPPLNLGHYLLHDIHRIKLIASPTQDIKHAIKGPVMREDRARDTPEGDVDVMGVERESL